MKYYFKENFHFLYTDGELYDEEGNVAYTFEQKGVMFPEVHLYRDGEDIGYVSTQFKILFREYYLYMNGEKKETINSLLTLFRTHLMLLNSHWSVNGSFMSLQYNIKNQKGNTVALVDRDLGFGQRYYIDILDEDNEVFILLIVLIINLYNKAASNAAASPPAA